jgi:uncharacterized protein YndB with AHSA1/START domain
MSTLKDLFHRSQSISVAAKEEYLRSGHPEIDVEHLFLALLIVGGPSGRVLGELGVTLHGAREATERVHAEQIGSLGLTPPTSLASSTIPDPMASDTRWSDRALKVMRHDNSLGDDTILLGHLLDEPSGHVVRVLQQLGLSESAVRESIATYTDSTEQRSPDGPQDNSPRGDSPAGGSSSVEPGATGPTRSGWQDVVYSGYIPASPDLVWSLVSDPVRRLEWDGYYYDSAVLRDDGILTTAARLTRPDGKPNRVKPAFRRTEHVVSRYEEGALIEWHLTWPDKPGIKTVLRMRVEVRPDGTGTTIRLTQSRLKRRSLVRWVLGPLYRFSAWQGLFARASAISRALR